LVAHGHWQQHFRRTDGDNISFINILVLPVRLRRRQNQKGEGQKESKQAKPSTSVTRSSHFPFYLLTFIFLLFMVSPYRS
jgi:hypothetical protein